MTVAKPTPRSPEYQGLVRRLRRHKEFFHRTMSCFRDEDASFRPVDGAMTVAGQVMHAASAMEFMLSGMFGPFNGWSPMSRRQPGFRDMSWTLASNIGPGEGPADAPEVQAAAASIAKALEFFDRTLDLAETLLCDQDTETLQRPLERNPLFPPGFTPAEVFEVMLDHTAHHRGALAQYARILGHEPKLPYFEMSEALHEAQLMQGAPTGPG